MKRSIVVLLALLCSGAIYAQQPNASADKRQVAVHVSGPTKDNERKALGNEIFYSLVKSGRFGASIRPTDFADTVTAEQKKGSVTDHQIVEIGKIMGIDYICVAEITEVPVSKSSEAPSSTYQVVTRLVDVKAGKVDAIGKAYSELKSVHDLSGAAEGVLKSMFSHHGQRGGGK
jgi:hypothetical protein